MASLERRLDQHVFFVAEVTCSSDRWQPSWRLYVLSLDGLRGSWRAEQKQRTNRTRYDIEVATRLSLYLVCPRLLYYLNWFNITKIDLYIFVKIGN